MTKPRLLIVGAGPAGVSAALWARDRFDAVLIDRDERPGGQLLGIHFAPPDLAVSENRDGAALAGITARQLDRSGVATRFGCPAAALEPPAVAEAGSTFESGIEPLRTGGIPLARPRVRTGNGEALEADAVLIATGLRRRKLAVPGEDTFESRGVSTSASRDRRALAGRDVIVIGGGDGAYESALLLAEVGCRVLLVMRSRPRARRGFRARVAAEPSIELMPKTHVRALLGADRLSAVRLEGPHGTFDRECEALIVKIGAVPNTEWCAAAVRTDRDGFIRSDRRGRTSAARVWAAGDVARPALFAISVAESSGALAVQDAWLELGGTT
jgi:thioredoxin reductase (NADPH)